MNTSYQTFQMVASKPDLSKSMAAMDSTLFDHEFIDKKESEKKKKGKEMKGVLSVLNEFTLKVTDMEKHHTSICDIDFWDPKLSARLKGAPKTKSIFKFVKVCIHFEWFYNKDDDIEISCCKA